MDYSPTAKYRVVATDTNGQAHSSVPGTLTLQEFNDMLQMQRGIGSDHLRSATVETATSEVVIPRAQLVSMTFQRMP